MYSSSFADVGFRLAYPVFLLKKLQEDRGQKELLVLYDIACVLEKRLKVKNQ